MSDWESAPSVIDDNTRRFLDFLGKAEGADYNTIVGGKTFDNFSAHPNVVGLRTKEGPSTAAGRYQILKSTYDDVAPKVGITDFSPESQDRIAVELIKRAGALQDIQKGDYNTAIGKLGKTWASLPSSPYSQPKRSADWVQKALDFVVTPAYAGETQAPALSNEGWESAPTKVAPPAAAPDDWESAPTVASVAESTPKAAPAEPPKTLLRRVDDAVRGIADTATFGYADEIAARLDRLFGINTGKQGAAPKNYDEALAAQRALDNEGGGARLTGQIAGAFVPGGAAKLAINAAPTASRLARIGAGAGTGAIQGALYGSGSAEGGLEDRAAGAAMGGTIGAVTGGLLGGVLPSTAKQEAGSIIKKAGSPERGVTDSEIVQVIGKVIDDPNRMINGKAPAISTKELNGKVTDYFLRPAQDAVKALDTGPEKKMLSSALNKALSLHPDDIEKLRTTSSGNAVADVILQAQRADKLTAAIPSNTLASGVRAVTDWIVPSKVSQGINAMLGQRVTRENVAAKLSTEKVREAADLVLKEKGPSAASRGRDVLQGMADQALAQQAARREAKLAARVSARAPKVENPNALVSDIQGKDPTYLLGLSNQLGAPRNADQMSEFSKLIRQQMEARAAKEAMAREAAKAARAGAETQTRNSVLSETRRPLGGGFQELLQGGRAGTNLKSDQAIDALRLIKRQGGVVGEAADQVLKSRPILNEDAFYGLQNAVKGLQERGILSGVPQASGAVSSGVRNPISYAEAVRTAGEAANIARASAPNKELAQFATKVAGTKSPADKIKLLQTRMDKATDPNEIAFLNQFVEPLTKFGAK